MKTLITLNIGLTTTKNTRVDVHHALCAIAACGVSITASAVVQGEWEGKPEACLFVQGFVSDPLGVAFRAQLFLASRLLSQHVIALYFDGRGELVGDNPEKWEFDPALFHFHPEGRAASRDALGRIIGFADVDDVNVVIYKRDALICVAVVEIETDADGLTDSEATDKALADFEDTYEFPEHDEPCPENSHEFTVDGQTKETFVRYLKETLIPDLKESGFEATAIDFETAIQFIRK